MDMDQCWIFVSSWLILLVVLLINLFDMQQTILNHPINYPVIIYIYLDPYIKHALLSGYSISLGIIIANKQTSKIFNRFTKHMQAK